MNLDDLTSFRQMDAQHMREELDSLPDRFEAAWQQGLAFAFPTTYSQVRQIVVAGMGNSAVAGDMVAVLAKETGKLPLIVHRGYDLPAYAAGEDTLVVIITHGGKSEEALSVLEGAQARGAQILALTANAALCQHIQAMGRPYASACLCPHEGDSRPALAWYFGLLLALAYRLALLPDPSADIAEVVGTLRTRVPVLGVEGRVVKNPAKRLAGQLIGRIPVIYGAGILAPVAHRWKMQLNENAKTWAEWDELPEVNHNAAAGIIFPRQLMTKLSVVILSSPQFDHPRIAIRQTLTKDLYLQQGIAVDVVKMRGHSPIGQMLSGIQYGDYVSYYVAMSYGVDPTPTPALAEIRERLASAQDVVQDSHE
ncbi:MAG TPA: bifunctional phosphoglucose/phosphomannose isomerase [Aggregatilineales bacterium]|nr:bifunctional phosphoglucose/phosphomannose isomerase [Aggregatilineales bacterium]